MRETPILHAVRAALVADTRVMLWRCNGGVDIVRGVRYGLGLGAADLVGLLRPHGRFIAFEIKSPTGRVSADQERWLRAVRNAGGFACVVRSVEDALAALARAEAGDSS